MSRNMPEHVGRCGSCHHHTRVLWWDIPPNPREDREEGLIDDYATRPIVHAVEVPKYSSKALRAYVSVASSLALDMTKSLI